MFANSKGKRLWMADEAGGFVAVKKPADIHSRPRGRGIPDWWVIAKDEDWLPPGATRSGSAKATGGSLLSLGLLPDADGADGGGGGDAQTRVFTETAPGAGGVKIGAGRKPQGYDAHGRYTGPRGGAASLLDGSVRVYGQDGRLYAVENGGGEDSGRDERVDGGDTPVLKGTLLVDSRRVLSDAGGGLSGGSEVRGPVTGPEVPKAPATLTWKNDDPSKPDPTPENLAPRMRDVVRSMRTDVPKLDEANVNSGTREPLARHDPHAEGRAIDVNRINGISVRELKTSTAPGAERAREAAGNLEQWARNNPNVNQIIGPNGGWEIKRGKWEEINNNDPRLKDHQHHYHINVFR